MYKKMEILIKVLDKSIEIYSNNEDVLLWLALESERYRLDLVHPRVGVPREGHLYLNGFNSHRDAEDYALWIKELLLSDNWEEDPRTKIPKNETWYKKSVRADSY